MTGVTAVVEARAVTKSYRRGPETVRALDSVSFALPAGELVALVGPSGSGKTTLLNVLTGWERADTGDVLWNGETGVDRALLSWSELAVVPQRLGLMEELSVRENVALPLRLSGTLDGAGAQRVDELLRYLGLEQLADRPPPETSLGEQQRTALARALLPVPRLLLADEPVGHQHATSAERVFRALRAAAGEGTCCLIATHDQETLKLCDRALRMTDGRVESLPARAARE
jgi:ABC-type lipoprotein export system ATPase subunit